MVLRFFRKKPKRRPRPRPKPKIRKRIRRPAVKPAVKPAIAKMPDERALELVKRARIPIPTYVFCKRERDLPAALRKVKLPAVLKVSSPRIVHKTEVGGVIKVNTEAEAASAFRKLMAIKDAQKVLVQRAMKGLELIVGAKADPQFGYIVTVGIGGIYVEILRDVTFRIAPITAADAEAMVRELKGYDILAGIRGARPINFAALHDVLVKVGRLAIAKRLKEMDINPLFCTPEGCWAADVRIVK
jgi:acyl-CoA synthetase (NDP forming)